MAEAKKSTSIPVKSDKTISDVAHPDQTAAEPSARPIIVTNRPIMKDPMVVHEQADEHKPVEDKPGLAETSNKAELKLPTAPVLKAESKAKVTDKAAEAATPAAAKDKIDNPTTDKVEPADQPEEVSKAEQPNKTEAENKEPVNPPEEAAQAQPSAETEHSADKDKTEASQADENKDGEAAKTADTTDAQTAKQAEHDSAIQKLVDSKQYYLPINAVEQRRSKRVVFIGIILSLVLALAWVDVALDAGLIHIGGIKAVTHFFSN